MQALSIQASGLTRNGPCYLGERVPCNGLVHVQTNHKRTCRSAAGGTVVIIDVTFVLPLRKGCEQLHGMLDICYIYITSYICYMHAVLKQGMYHVKAGLWPTVLVPPECGNVPKFSTVGPASCSPGHDHIQALGGRYESLWQLVTYSNMSCETPHTSRGYSQEGRLSVCAWGSSAHLHKWCCKQDNIALCAARGWLVGWLGVTLYISMLGPQAGYCLGSEKCVL